LVSQASWPEEEPRQMVRHAPDRRHAGVADKVASPRVTRTSFTTKSQEIDYIISRVPKRLSRDLDYIID
jgi:hypothetical protein